MKEFISENRGLVRAIIRKLTGSYNEDIEQEVYIKTWRSLGSYQEEGRFRQWVATLTANVCRDYFKSRAYRQKCTEICDDETLETIRSGYSQEEIINAKMRKVIILFEFEGLSQEQIARKTGVPVGTVKSRLFHARQILSQKLSYLKGE